jgi:hypothetical protein
MRDRVTRLLLPALACALAAGLGLATGAAPARAQSFFAESDALQPETAVDVTLSDLTDDASASSGGATAFSNVDASLHRVDGRFRYRVLAAGAMSESRRFHQVTDTFDLRSDRDQSAGYGALVFDGLLTSSDALYLVFSGGRRHEAFSYSTYERLLDANVGLQGGLVYRIGVLIAGAIRGQETMQLRITDVTALQERYRFDYSAWLAGLQFGDPDVKGLVLVWQRKNTPAVPGVSVNLEAGIEELLRADFSLGRLRLHASQVHVTEAFTGQTSRDTTERELALGLQLTPRVFMAVSRRRIADQQDFTLGGVPSIGHTDRSETLFQFGLRF